MSKAASISFVVAALTCLSSCYKKDIQFGNELGEAYINLSNVDTVAVDMSTIVLDSFATNNPVALLVGRYKDPYLGVITAKPVFQLALPADVTLEPNAIYDSLTFMGKLNGNYYGDTSTSNTLIVHELDQTIDYTYGTQLFNTSMMAVKPTSLGSKAMVLSPSNDSVTIRLNDAKGIEIFNKLRDASTEVSSPTDFLNYFKGVSLSLGAADTSLLYAMNSSADSVKMRLHYHTNNPYPEEKYKDFPYNDNDLAFNQLLSDRTGTQLQSPGSTSGLKAFTSAVTGNQSYMQSGAGVLLKITFPSLRNILQLGSTVKLLGATLVVRVAAKSFDNYRFKLPPQIFLAKTDATNTMGSVVYDAGTGGVSYGVPESDYIYNTNVSYRFTVTSDVNTLLSTPGTAASGFFLMENYPGTLNSLNRLVANNANHADLSSQLILSVLTIKNN